MTFDLPSRAALVTGASAGIGREIARVLARDVATLVLVARREDRLTELATELRAARPALRVVVRAVDLNDRAATGAMLDALEQEGLALDVLVNNAGFGDQGLFETTAWEKTERMLELNVVSATFLLHRLVPAMVRRGRGAILNVGSTAGMFPSPGLAVYSATKAYVNLLSECLAAELAGTGVTVTALCPGPVPTEFQEVAGTSGKNPMPKAFHIDAAQCAEEAVSAMRAGEPRVIPGAAVRATMTSVELLPRPLVRVAARQMARKLRG